jgi:hypothetical protein
MAQKQCRPLAKRLLQSGLTTQQADAVLLTCPFQLSWFPMLSLLCFSGSFCLAAFALLRRGEALCGIAAALCIWFLNE